GRITCCKQFLGDFEPVSIKMAKEQSLSLNPAKISGLCGRLMCCLKYEHENYEELIQHMPEVGTLVKTKDGEGIVVSTYTLLERVKVRVKLEDDTEDLLYYQIQDIEKIEKKHSKTKTDDINKD